MRSLIINSRRVTSFRAWFASGFGLSLLLLFAGSVQADSLVVQPTQLNLSAVKPVSNLLLRNDSAEEQTILIDINAWQQVGSRDQLIPSGKLIVHPDKVQLRPGESAQVRVGLKMSGPLWKELAFQLQLTEVPRIPDMGTKQNRVSRRSAVPVFLLPPGKVSPRISWNVDRGTDGSMVLSASNGGGAHVQLQSARLVGPHGQSIEMSNLSSMILPGGTRSWKLMEDLTGGQWQLTANTNAGAMQTQLELGPNFSSSRSLTLSEKTQPLH